MRSLFIVCMALLGCSSAFGATYYVSGKGSDHANGHSPRKAFRTLQHAADLTLPGDTVYALNGTYSAEPSNTGSVLSITRSGTADKWISYQALPGQQPKIQTNVWNGIAFGPRVSYVEVNGFTVEGNDDNLDPKEALKRANVPTPIPDPAYDGNCISVDGRKGTTTERPHHIRILNNTISKCGGGGVAIIQADYITISGNTIFNCSWYSIYGTSGISTLESWNSDDSTGYKMIITRNRLYGNKELVPWVSEGKITDGEAIIIDTLRSPTLGTYKGRTLVANNVIFDNGSAAIEVFRSDHVDVLNNSTYENVRVPEESGRGELNLNDAADVHVRNNIFYSAAGQNPLDMDAYKPCDCSLETNIYFNGSNTPTGLQGFGDIVANPLYLSVDVMQPATVDLRVAKGSPAVDSGVTALPAITDFVGKQRPIGAGWDRGAYEQ